MKAKLILPSLTEAKSPYWRPIKYSLFPPIGLATLAAYFNPDDEVEIVDQHVETLKTDDRPDLVLIQVYITNAYRAYRIADIYRAKGSFVILGGLHVTSLPHEANPHVDAIFLGPAEQTFPRFLADFRAKRPQKIYESGLGRTLLGQPFIRRDLIKKNHYLVPNSLVISRGCPHHCDFCYKDAFFKGGKSFYTQQIDQILADIDRMPGKHLYFLDDHLLGNPKLARELFLAMRGMGRVFQGAATVSSILDGDLISLAADAGLRSLFVGFETFSPENLEQSNKTQNLKLSYEQAAQRLDRLGVMINGSFVFGLDSDGPDVFKRTVDWAIQHAITTATFHVLTPYPGTRLYENLVMQKRIVTSDWDLYDTRHVVYKPAILDSREIEAGYRWAYKEFYSWQNIFKAARNHEQKLKKLKHFMYAGGWKKMEPFWKFVINAGALEGMLPLLELLLSEFKPLKNMDKKYPKAMPDRIFNPFKSA